MALAAAASAAPASAVAEEAAEEVSSASAAFSGSAAADISSKLSMVEMSKTFSTEISSQIHFEFRFFRAQFDGLLRPLSCVKQQFLMMMQQQSFLLLSNGQANCMLSL